MKPLLRDNGRCFVCGKDNPVGFKLAFERGDGVARTQVTLDGIFQGFVGMAHGGVAGALLDEAMWYALESADFQGATVELTVRYLRPVPLEEVLLLEGKAGKIAGRLAEASATLTDAGGTVLTQAAGKFLRWKEGGNGKE